MSDDEILNVQQRIADQITAKLNAARQETIVTKVIELLLTRIVFAGKSIQSLQEHAPHDFLFDSAMILRGIYDAMLQALYILHDPACREERAKLYLDFRWVEKIKFIRLFDGNTTSLARRISNSSLRASAEPALEQEFQRVKGQFEDAKGRLRNHWYPENNLRCLAIETGFESEYEILQQQLSGYVHSSSYALIERPPFQGFLAVDLTLRFGFRVLGKFAEYAGVSLDAVEMKLVSLAQQNVFDF